MMFHGSALLLQLEFWLLFSFAVIVNMPFLYVWGKNAQFPSNWDTILFPMSLVSSSKPFYGRDTPAQKHSQLTSAFDRLELYNLTATHNCDEVLPFLLARYSFIFDVVSEVVPNDFEDDLCFFWVALIIQMNLSIAIIQ